PLELPGWHRVRVLVAFEPWCSAREYQLTTCVLPLPCGTCFSKWCWLSARIPDAAGHINIAAANQPCSAGIARSHDGAGRIEIDQRVKDARWVFNPYGLLLAGAWHTQLCGHRPLQHDRGGHGDGGQHTNGFVDCMRDKTARGERAAVLRSGNQRHLGVRRLGAVAQAHCFGGYEA